MNKLLKRVKVRNLILLFLLLFMMNGCKSKIEQCNDTFEKYQKSCNMMGNIDSCYKMGLALQDGMFIYENDICKVNIDYSKATNFLKKACDANNIDACYDLGKRVDSKYIDALIKACEHKNANACGMAGARFHLGFDNLQKDNKKALYFSKKGCEYGDDIACGNFRSISTNIGISQKDKKILTSPNLDFCTTLLKNFRIANDSNNYNKIIDIGGKIFLSCESNVAPNYMKLILEKIDWAERKLK